LPTEPINTLPIQQFIQQVKSADNSKARDVKLSIDQAKNLAFTLGIVMGRLNGDLEKLIASKSGNISNDAEIEVKLDGGSNWQ
jgi:hypothetical protein